MHPTHIPLQAKPQAAYIGGMGDHRPGSRFFGESLRIGIIAIDSLVQVAQESNRIQVLPAAITVGNPFAFFAAIIQVKHRRHRIQAQSVNMIFIKPE
jgi:hypothetical protein